MKCENEQCCCKCKWQIKLHVCNCGKCPSVIGGYVCIGLNDNPNEPKMGTWFPNKHGECEVYDER